MKNIFIHRLQQNIFNSKPSIHPTNHFLGRPALEVIFTSAPLSLFAKCPFPLSPNLAKPFFLPFAVHFAASFPPIHIAPLQMRFIFPSSLLFFGPPLFWLSIIRPSCRHICWTIPFCPRWLLSGGGGQEKKMAFFLLSP
jgi:hypothetical protein